MKRVLLVAVVLAGAAPAVAEEPPVRTRLAWLFGDDDVLRPASSTREARAGLGVGERDGYGAFYDAIAARDDGRESWLELGVASRAPAHVVGVETHAALALAARLDGRLGSATPPVLEDRGTRLGASFGDGPRGVLELYPFDSDGLRLGALHALSWGGTRADRAESSFPGAEPGVPAALARLELRAWELFAVFKIAAPREPADGAPLFGVLAGARWDATPGLRLRAGAGRIAHPNLAPRGGPDERGYAAALNVRVSVHDGGPVEPRAPGAFSGLRDDAELDPSPGWALALEATTLVQHLADPDRPGASAIEPATGVALQAELAGAGLDSSLLLSARELAFVVRDVPGLLPQQALPRAGRAEPELAAAVSTAITASAPFVPELVLGLRLPASFSAPGSVAPPVLVRAPGDLAPLVAGTRRVPVFEARAGGRWRLSPLLVVGAFLSYRRDNNLTAIFRDGQNVLLRRFAAPDFFGAGLQAQADF